MICGYTVALRSCRLGYFVACINKRTRVFTVKRFDFGVQIGDIDAHFFLMMKEFIASELRI